MSCHYIDGVQCLRFGFGRIVDFDFDKIFSEPSLCLHQHLFQCHDSFSIFQFTFFLKVFECIIVYIFIFAAGRIVERRSVVNNIVTVLGERNIELHTVRFVFFGKLESLQ